MIEKKNEEKSDPKSAYQISIRSEIKKQYDSNLYGVPIEGNNLFLMDRQGNMFLFNYKNEESMKIAGNKFSYNESVTGLERFDKYLFVTTTKGAIKVFTYKLKQWWDIIYNIKIWAITRIEVPLVPSLTWTPTSRSKSKSKNLIIRSMSFSNTTKSWKKKTNLLRKN